MRYLAVFLSFLLHIIFVCVLIDAGGILPEMEPHVLDLELVSLSGAEKNVEQKPKAVAPAEKKISPKKPEPPAKKKVIKEKPEPSKKHARKPGKTSGPVSPPTKEVKRTTPKAAKAGKPIVPSPAAPVVETGSSVSPNAVVLRQGKGVTIGNTTVVLKRGSESRSMDSIAGYDFDENDFRGHYETISGRQVVIIDDRKEHGRLVLHDRKTGLTRRLKKAGYGDFIYTYGPSFDQDEPVEGSVVFLPGDEHWIHRFMWLPADETAEYPVKGRVDAFKGEDRKKEEDLFVPVRDGEYPAVILVGFGQDISADRFSEVARHLCGRGVVVLVLDRLTNLSLEKAVERLRGLAKVDKERVGLWVRGYRPGKLPRIPSYAGQLGFVIMTIDSPQRSLYPERFASAIPEHIPVFIGFRNVRDDWKRVLSVMHAGLTSVPHKLILLDEHNEARKDADITTDWVDSLSGDFVNSISAWLDSQ
ncbi:hypothetical protein [Maridesulfovibrio sp.]|uniref:hypothetical protein n=1 Tax=Maridesulfovibrio sp. TaxID=2795000 RepID=UPI002A187AE7|nr:hypothetical protein [Maridesulfovibrio sp.]